MSEEKNESKQTWGQRHAVTIMTVVMFSLLVMVMVIQVAC
jgi:hypothetical protein